MEKYRVKFINGRGREFYIPCRTLAEAKRQKREGIRAGYEYIGTEKTTARFTVLLLLLAY